MYVGENDSSQIACLHIVGLGGPERTGIAMSILFIAFITSNCVCDIEIYLCCNFFIVMIIATILIRVILLGEHTLIL